MTLLSLAICLVFALAPPAGDVRAVTVSVTGPDGPIASLGRDDVALLEDGVARTLVSVERDERPLLVVILVDSSQPVASSYRLNVIPAVVEFVAGLPEAARYAIWTTGDRPRQVVEPTDDRGAALGALRKVFPQGGNTVLDAVVEVAEELEPAEGSRVVLVVVSGSGVGFSNYDRREVVRRVAATGYEVQSLIYDADAPAAAAAGSTGVVTRGDYEYALGTLAERTGGAHDNLLSPMGTARVLERIGDDLAGRFRIRYVSPEGSEGRRIEVEVAHPGATVRLVEGGVD